MATHWAELKSQYGETGRTYHNLVHIEHVLEELEEVRQFAEDWDSLRFAAIYHDIIYRALRRDNEEQSAIFAVERLGEIGIPFARAERVYRHILATKKHKLSFDTDSNLLCDADLSILGHERERYVKYTQDVRKEYKTIPDLVYRPARRKVLREYLERPMIYLTPRFRDRYEMIARENLRWELSL